jgi:hypothetical protein
MRSRSFLLFGGLYRTRRRRRGGGRGGGDDREEKEEVEEETVTEETRGDDGAHVICEKRFLAPTAPEARFLRASQGPSSRKTGFLGLREMNRKPFETSNDIFSIFLRRGVPKAPPHTRIFAINS